MRLHVKASRRREAVRGDRKSTGVTRRGGPAFKTAGVCHMTSGLERPRIEDSCINGRSRLTRARRLRATSMRPDTDEIPRFSAHYRESEAAVLDGCNKQA